MRILLLGANGQLGRTFVEHGGLAARGELIVASRDGRLFDGTSCEAVDLADPTALSGLLDLLQPQLIVNTAAYTSVDRAEQEETSATCVNGEAVSVIGKWAVAHNALVIHYSTDYVFDGAAQSPYPMAAPTDPLGAYGRSKLAGEQALRASGAEHLIFRTAWVYAAHGQNFLRTMLRVGAEREELRVVADQQGTPTSTLLIVRATLAALDRWQTSDPQARRALAGTHHLVASGITNWHAFAAAIFERAVSRGLLPRAPRVVPITTAEFPTPARRPAWSVLDNREFQPCFDIVLPDWSGGLDEIIEQLAREIA